MAPSGGLGGVFIVGLFFEFLCVTECYAYRKYLIGSDKVCSLVKKQTMKIAGEDAIMVYDAHTFDRWPGVFEFRCKFEVEHRNGKEIFAVIQYLNFRRDIVTGQCIDYIQFTGDDGRKSERICGHVDAMRHRYGNLIVSEESDDISPTAFVDHEGEITVEIYVARLPLRPDGEELSLNLVFTSTAFCTPDTLRCVFGKCILMEYLNDGYVNCPYTSCSDELKCSSYTPMDSVEQSIINSTEEFSHAEESSVIKNPESEKTKTDKITTKEEEEEEKEKEIWKKIFFMTCISALNKEDIDDEQTFVGKNVAAKLRQVNFQQRVLAESLIQQVLTRALLNELTRNTALEEHSVSNNPSMSYASTRVQSQTTTVSNDHQNNLANCTMIQPYNH